MCLGAQASGNRPAKVIRYADPTRDLATPRGLIFVPGATPNFVPIEDILGRNLPIPRPLDVPGGLRVWLAYAPYPPLAPQKRAPRAESRACRTTPQCSS